MSTASLSAAGVSIWLDDLSRERIASGNLASLIETHTVRGVTTNPTIFAAALRNGESYTEQVAATAAAGKDGDEAIFDIIIKDVQDACDIFRPIFEESGGEDGRVSIEVSPELAHDTSATVAQARQLWDRVDRPNAMIKIPATKEGLPAITEVIGHGISVNVTLIFSLARYGEVVDAYLAGLEEAQRSGHALSDIHSVASLFVSRVDTEVDARLEKIGTEEALALRGKAGVANARLVYEIFEKKFASERFATLAADHAHAQRPLWASTGVKNPNYPDTLYVTELVAPATVNTMPEKTLEATADHAEITGDTVRDNYGQAHRVFEELAAVGVDMGDVAAQLESEGVEKFIVSWKELSETVSAALAAARA
ncbi:transaldolase [Actinotignum sp. GS-2025b]|uniref:transaldolase n=1 Tax=Actinotignum sp. GS-2025b TaxID=3427275 RepID=UPI003F469AC3